MRAVPSFYDPRYNNYVPRMEYASSVHIDGPTTVILGRPAAAAADSILDDANINTAGSTDVLRSYVADTPYGRNITVVASGTATSAVHVDGWDYLGQPMTETFTLNGSTPVVGVKAFKELWRVRWAATASRTIDVGWGGRIGFPFRVRSVLEEYVNNVRGTVGTLTVGVLTDPATATTGDPRGLYTPNAALNGTNEIGVLYTLNPFVNSNGNGGLHGIRHFSA